MSSRLQLNAPTQLQAVPRFQLSPVTLGQSRPRFTPPRLRLWPEQLHLSIESNLELLICDQKTDRPGYDLLTPAIRATLLNLAAREAGPGRPPWLSAASPSGQPAAAAEAADPPPFLYAQFQFMPAGTAPQLTLHAANRGHPSWIGSWDSAAGALGGELILTFHKEDERGWELSLLGLGNMNLSTNPALTGGQGAGAATYILPIAKGLQFQTVILGTIGHDFGGSTSAGLSLGGMFQYDLTERLHLTAGLTTGLNNRWTGFGPHDTSSPSFDNTFAIGFMIDTDKIRIRHR
jgi:hypothetical protein